MIDDDKIVTAAELNDEIHAELKSLPTNDLPASQKLNRGGQRWPDDQEKIFRNLWQQGLTTLQIAEQMGLSRNAVVGKRYRLGLAALNLSQQQINSLAKARQLRQNARKHRHAKRERDRRAAAKGHPAKPLATKPLATKPVDPRCPPTFPTQIWSTNHAAIKPKAIPLMELTSEGGRPTCCRAIVIERPEILYCGLPNMPGESWCLGHCRRYLNRYNPQRIKPDIKAAAISTLIK